MNIEIEFHHHPTSLVTDIFNNLVSSLLYVTEKGVEIDSMTDWLSSFVSVVSWLAWQFAVLCLPKNVRFSMLSLFSCWVQPSRCTYSRIGMM